MSTALPHLVCRLDQAPSRRWQGVQSSAPAIQELTQAYFKDLNPGEWLDPLLLTAIQSCIPKDMLAELQAMSACTQVDLQQLILCNVYYDIAMALIGCTAFALPGADGPWHGRNLDWWSENAALARLSCISDYEHNGELRFQSVGWPGFIGSFSAMAPGRFSISLNAVCGTEPAQLAIPISLLIRQVCEHAENFNEAVTILRDTALACHCLLLVVGTNNAERVVIERSPNQHALRWPQADEALVVTNSFHKLGMTSQLQGHLGSSSCSRFDTCSSLLKAKQALQAQDFMDILQDPGVRMEISMQHMLFHCASGTLQAISGRPA